MNINYSQLMNDSGVSAILITDPYNLRYYTGFRGGEGYALITNKDSKVLITDSRYTEAAEKECYTGFTVRQYDTKISIYKEYDRMLKKRFGNYMALPPIEERKSGHNWEYIKYNNEIWGNENYDKK